MCVAECSTKQGASARRTLSRRCRPRNSFKLCGKYSKSIGPLDSAGLQRLQSGERSCRIVVQCMLSRLVLERGDFCSVGLETLTFIFLHSIILLYPEAL